MGILRRRVFTMGATYRPHAQRRLVVVLSCAGSILANTAPIATAAVEVAITPHRLLRLLFVL